MGKVLKEFKEFLLQGNLITLAGPSDEERRRRELLAALDRLATR